MIHYNEGSLKVSTQRSWVIPLGTSRVSRPTQQKTHNLFWPDENSIEQCCAAHIVQGCQQY